MDIDRHLTTWSARNNTEDLTTWRVINIYWYLTTRSVWLTMAIWQHRVYD
jgi:hypothetical protein